MTSEESVDPNQLLTIAMIGGTDEETRAIVTDALEGIGVSTFIEGSVVYAVQVYRSDSTRAQKALKADPRLTDRWITYVESTGG